MSTGETGPGAMVIQEADTIRVTADVLPIRTRSRCSTAANGSQIHAGDIALPGGVTWLTTPSQKGVQLRRTVRLCHRNTRYRD